MDISGQPDVRRLLALAGIPCKAEPLAPGGRVFTVEVAEAEAHLQDDPQPPAVHSPLAARARQLACGALHALRRPAGCVRLLEVEGRFSLLSLSDGQGSGGAPAPAPPVGVPLMIGADPEFILRHRWSRGLVPASRYFGQAGLLGCDALRTEGEQPIAEVRPLPATCPIILLQRIGAALLGAADNLEAAGANVELLAGSQPLPRLCTGGHIHLSGIQVTGHLLRALDNYVALPLALLEQPAAARRRRRRFGKLGEFEPKGHGGFEYRTPGSWLGSPRLAAAALCLSYLVAQHHADLARDPLAELHLQLAFYSADKAALRPLLPGLQADLTALPAYARYAPHLDWLWDALARGLQWREGADLIPFWRRDLERH